MMRRLGLLWLLVAFGFSSLGQTYPLRLCSFNIQFLGSSKSRDDAGLASLLRDYDIVVVQEMVGPPCQGRFPNGDPYVLLPKAQLFCSQIQSNGFSYVLSEEDTGPGNKIHSNGSATEWWVAFYKPREIEVATDLPTGFLADKHAHNPDYDRVPYAFGFRTADHQLDFVLVSVHLRPGSVRLSKVRRKHELASIATWVQAHSQKEKDFIILGDMNIENASELAEDTPAGFKSLNESCLPTNTNLKSRKPYDHVLYRVDWTKEEVDWTWGFQPVDLIQAMRPSWKAKSTARYPGDPPYNHNKFRAYYSDHDPVEFRMVPLPRGDHD